MQQNALAIIFFGLFAFNGSAQQFQKVIQPSYYLPLVVIVNQEKSANLIEESIAKLPESLSNQYHFLMLYGEKMDTAWIVQTINKQLNDIENNKFDKQKIYVVVMNTHPEIENFLSERSIFADIATCRNPDNDLASVLGSFKNKYLWTVDVQKIEQNNTITSYKNRRLGFGFLLGQMSQNQPGNDSFYIPNRVIRYGASVNYRLSNRIELLGKFMAGFEIPNQSKLQSEIFSQIDIAAGGEQTISAEIKFHMFFQSSLQANYLFKPMGKVQPFAGAGLAMIFFRAGKQKIEETIDVSSISGGGGPPNFGSGFNPAEGGLPGNSKLFLDPFANIGLAYRIAPKTSLTAHLDYHFLNRSGVVNGMQVSSNSTKLYPTVGLQFSLGKTSRKYNYMNAYNKTNTRA